jgi:hypothetical protein
MTTTLTHDVHPQWLPEQLHNAVWTDFTDVSILMVGSIVFDHQNYAMYHGEVTHISVGKGTAMVCWRKSVDNVFSEMYTFTRLEHAQLWWIDPVMQEG